MASKASLQAHTRSTTGKGAARSLRRSGVVPGIIYGHHRQPESLQIDAAALTRLLVGAHSSTLVDVTVDDRAPVKALIREIQRNPLRGSTIVHIDLYEVRADEKVAVEVAIKLVGTPDGVRNHGGVLEQQLHALQIKALPADIPELIEIDVTQPRHRPVAARERPDRGQGRHRHRCEPDGGRGGDAARRGDAGGRGRRRAGDGASPS